MQLAARRQVARLDGEGLLELTDRLLHLVLPRVDGREIDVGEVARLVARRTLGPLEPGDGLLLAAEGEEIGADVVVGVAEAGIHRDGALALLDSVLVLSLMRHGPSEKGVGLCRLLEGERATIALQGFL